MADFMGNFISNGIIIEFFRNILYVIYSRAGKHLKYAKILFKFEN